MLLRRFMTHVHEQNWFAVVLDFLIVVFGVFIGIQVDGWNQSRIDVRQEREYLELLVRDLDSDYGTLEKFTDAVEHHVSATGAIIEMAEGGPATTVAIEQAFTYLYLTLDYTPPAPTYIGLRRCG